MGLISHPAASAAPIPRMRVDKAQRTARIRPGVCHHVEPVCLPSVIRAGMNCRFLLFPTSLRIPLRF